MARSTRVKPGTPKTRRKGYESLDHNSSDEEYTFVEGDKVSEEDTRGQSCGNHHADADAASLSDDGSSIENEDNVKLLPLSKGGESRSRHTGSTPVPDNASASASTLPPGDPSEEKRDVGKAIEQFLESERTMLSESFDTDLEDGSSHLVLSDDDSDDYGIPGNKGRKKPIDNGIRSWRSGVRSVLPLKAWWHVFPLVAIGLIVMWLAMKGLRWVRSKPVTDEYVRGPCFDL